MNQVSRPLLELLNTWEGGWQSKRFSEAVFVQLKGRVCPLWKGTNREASDKYVHGHVMLNNDCTA